MNNNLIRVPQEEELRDMFADEKKVDMRDIQDRMHDFWRDHKVTVIAGSLLIVWTCVTCSITGAIVEQKTTEKVTKEVTMQVEHDMRQGFQKYLDQKKEEEQKAGFLTGDASKQAAIDAMVEPIAEHIAGLRMDRGVTIDGVCTYIWGVDFTRLDSGKYGSTIQDVLDGNVEAYKFGHSVRDEDRELARELVTAYMNGERPNRWTPDLEFAEINADGSVTARSKLKTDSTTKFWRYE